MFKVSQNVKYMLLMVFLDYLMSDVENGWMGSDMWRVAQ